MLKTAPTQPFSLGLELYRATPRSPAQTAKAQGFPFWWLFYYVLVPYFFMPIVATYLSAIPALALEKLGVAKGPMVLIIPMVIVYFLLIWHVYFFPRGDHLILHEHGLSIRYGFKRRQFPFAAIQAIYVGRPVSAVRQKINSINRIFHPGIARLADYCSERSLTIALRDGSQHVFKAILTRFEPADMEKLFAELIAHTPNFKPPMAPEQPSQ